MKTLHVLAIEYNLQDAEVIKYMLTAAGKTSFSVSLSHGYTRGLALLKKNDFDAVLLDVRLIDRAGSSPAQSLQTEFPLVPVILLAHGYDEELALRAAQGGVEDYLIRERLTPDLLVRAIRSAVERKRLSFENAGLLKDRERLEEEIRQMIKHDPLTGLPSRQLFRERIALERDRADRQGKKMALVVMALDGFKKVQEEFGRDAGHAVLTEAASRLRSLLRKSDMVARTGPEAFSIILPDIVRPEDVGDIARAIGDAFRKPFPVKEHTLRSTASIGIAMFPDDSREIDTLLNKVDAALRRARGLGDGRYQFFDPATNAKDSENRKFENELLRSVDAGELTIYYQPLVDISTRRIVCAEALARWRHPEKGLLSPNEFIPAAEEAGLITAIDKWVLRRVLSQAKSWSDAGLSPVCVTVNLSSRQLHDPGLIRTVSALLEETGVPAGCLYFEIPEKTAMSDVDRTAARLKEVAGLGIHISIDDFGTGYSSLNQLERLPVERLTIDKSFIQRVPADPDNRTIVRSVTSLAHNMRMKVVAQGVETEDQLRFVRATGCDEMQGYLFSKPLPAVEFGELLARR